MMKMELYLAYGSNLNKKQMKYRCPDAIKVGRTVIKDYKLNFRGTRRGSGVANIERCKGSTVPAGIWMISKKDEESLDMYEGYPFLYLKYYLRFSYNDKEYIGLSYIMRPGHPVLEPALGYENTIREGYADFGIDTKPLNKAIENCINDYYVNLEYLYGDNVYGYYL